MTRRDLNTDWKDRDRIITGEESPYKQPSYSGGIFPYQDMSVDTLKELRDKNYLDPEDCQNDSPSIEQFIELMERHPLMTAHGYAVSFERDDYRFSVEGVEGIVEGTAGLFDVLKLCREADEFDVEPTAPPRHMVEAFKFRAWWD